MTYVQDKKDTIWEAKLRIANSVNGEKILYDIYPIKKVEGARTLATTSTTTKVTQSDPKVKENSDETDSFSDRNVTLTSNRSLLANALETTVQNDEERKKLQAYRDKIGQIEADEQRLSYLKKQIYELSFAQGPRDAEYREKRYSLQKEAPSTERRLNKSEKELLELEATRPLQDLLKREKDAVKRRMEKKHRQALRTQKEKAAEEQAALKAEYATQREKAVESRKRSEIKLKIRNAIRALYKLYSRGKDVNNVKEEMKDVVASALASAEMLFDNLYSDDDIIRNGVGLTLTTDAHKMFCANRSVDGMAKQLIIELGGKERKPSKSKIKNVARNISDYIGWSYEKLYYALEKVGSETLAKLFANLANAEDTIMKMNLKMNLKK